MANVELLVPHILKWEAGAVRAEASNEQLFELARRKGWSDKKSDRGGKTMIGVTIATYTAYRRKKGLTTTADDLRNIPYGEWRDILKTMFWDRWRADEIENQSIANLLVDWVWGSGVWGIKLPQRVLNVTDDGIVGRRTLAAVNLGEPSTVFAALWRRRKKHFEDIAKKPGQGVNLKGWLNRLYDLKFKG